MALETDADPPHETAPTDIAFCSRCGDQMNTELVRHTPRRRCPRCRFIYFVEPRVGVGALVARDNAILLVQRGMPPEKGKWCLPAGFLDAGELPEQTAVRETLEETGLEIQVDGLEEVFSSTDDRGTTVFLLYRASETGGALMAADDAVAAEFFDLESFPEALAFDSTRYARAWLERNFA